MKRHNSRILAMMTLYQYDIIEHSKLKDILEEDKIKEIATYSEIEDNSEGFDVDENFYNSLVNGVLTNLEEVDKLISSNLVKWPLDRLSFVDRAILRLAAYEMKFTNTPKNVVIDEALLISDDYADTDDYPAKKFNNKVLDSIKESLNAK